MKKFLVEIRKINEFLATSKKNLEDFEPTMSEILKSNLTSNQRKTLNCFIEQNNNATKAGKELGISGSAVRETIKRCKRNARKQKIMQQMKTEGWL